MSAWGQLKRFTQARVALGRTGSSLPTNALLDFELAHAKARDAVYAALDVDAMERDLEALGWGSMRVHSAARDRSEYLRHPDLGRQLGNYVACPRINGISRETKQISEIRRQATQFPNSPEILFVIADGLSALAADRHALPLLNALKPMMTGWYIGPVVIAEQARVALGDELGEHFGARLVVVLIGERPGLSAPDSLGAYLTYDPHQGRSDAERNCISNIRPEGLSYELAAHRLYHLLESSRRLRLSGIALKDQSQQPPAILT